jgi:hypothetical protein
MDLSYSRICRIISIGSLLLFSCSPARSGPGGTETATTTPTPSPTTVPYWDLLPLEFDPIGGWITYHMDDYGISFEYPAVYQDLACGKIFREDKVTEFYQAHLFGFEGGIIRIHIFKVWDSDLDKLAREGQPSAILKLVTPVERFSLGGIPAFRYIALIPESQTLDYSKIAVAYYHDMIYMFSFANLSYLASCEAYPLTEEQVYEHMLSTLEFME